MKGIRRPSFQVVYSSYSGLQHTSSVCCNTALAKGVIPSQVILKFNSLHQLQKKPVYPPLVENDYTMLVFIPFDKVKATIKITPLSLPRFLFYFWLTFYAEYLQRIVPYKRQVDMYRSNQLARIKCCDTKIDMNESNTCHFSKNLKEFPYSLQNLSKVGC